VLPPPRRDAACMAGALSVAVAVAAPLSRAQPGFQFVPPLAVAVAGAAYLALASAAHLAAKNRAWDQSTSTCGFSVP